MREMLKFRDLEPRFLRRTGEKSYKAWLGIMGAEGVRFKCPRCALHDDGTLRPEGVHLILCWSPVVPVDMPPSPGRWYLEGTGLEDLSLVGTRSNSVQLNGGCNAHFFVERGNVRMV